MKLAKKARSTCESQVRITDSHDSYQIRYNDDDVRKLREEGLEAHIYWFVSLNKQS